MTLTELLAAPHSEEALFDVEQRWLEASLTPIRVPFLEDLSLAEKRHLITHLVYNQEAWYALPAGSADAIFPVIADAAEPYNPLLRRLVCMSEAIAGPETAKWIRTALESLIDFQRGETVHLRILWKVYGTQAIPLTARRLAALYKSELTRVERDTEALREAAGISHRVWQLLMQLEPNASVFKNWMELGVSIPAWEMRLLLDHSAHAEILKSLVLFAGQMFTVPDWPPVDEKDATWIAHPAMFRSEDELNHWKSRAHPNAPFDQFQRAAFEALGFDPIGLCADPTVLFLHLEAHGWVRGRADREGVLRTHSRTFPELNVTATVEYEPGIPTRFGGRWHPQTVHSYRFFRHDDGLEIAKSRVHPIVLANVMVDLMGLRKP